MLSRHEATSGRIESSQQKKLQQLARNKHGLRQIRPAKTGFLFCPCRLRSIEDHRCIQVSSLDDLDFFSEVMRERGTDQSASFVRPAAQAGAESRTVPGTMGAVVVPLAARPAAWVVAMVGEVDIDGGSRWAIGRRAPLELLFPSKYPPVPRLFDRMHAYQVSLTDSCKFILCSTRARITDCAGC